MLRIEPELFDENWKSPSSQEDRNFRHAQATKLKGLIGITEGDFFGFSLNFVGSATHAWSFSMAPVTYVVLLLCVLSDSPAAVCMRQSFFSFFHDILPNNRFEDDSAIVRFAFVQRNFFQYGGGAL
jgi:hypothetical protein